MRQHLVIQYHDLEIPLLGLVLDLVDELYNNIKTIPDSDTVTWPGTEIHRFVVVDNQ